jgi:ring-1,2-phenylacetyl-CoA epoxidase subunit PaaE
MADFHKVHIKEVKRETANAVSVLFDIPTNLKENFKFLAGQYITLQTEIDETLISRSYSLCSTPKSGDIRVSVKEVENGTFSTHVNTKLKSGDIIEIKAPEGGFHLKPEANKNYIAFAAGSGITPILSMIQSTFEDEPTSIFTLVYGNKTAADTIFYDDLNALKEKYSTHFKLHYIFSREDVKNQLRGRIDKSVTNYFVKNMYKETSFDAAYLCGPEEMIQEVSNTLKANNFKEENIHFELFTTSVNEEAIAKIKEGTTEITVMLDDEETTFTMQQTDDILAATLRNNLDAPYSCQGGVCSSCMCKVTEGKAVMIKNSILTDSEVEEGFILACQAHPTTSKITIDFDDV